MLNQSFDKELIQKKQFNSLSSKEKLLFFLLLGSKAINFSGVAFLSLATIAQLGECSKEEASVMIQHLVDANLIAYDFETEEIIHKAYYCSHTASSGTMKRVLTDSKSVESEAIKREMATHICQVLEEGNGKDASGNKKLAHMYAWFGINIFSYYKCDNQEESDMKERLAMQIAKNCGNIKKDTLANGEVKLEPKTSDTAEFYKIQSEPIASKTVVGVAEEDLKAVSEVAEEEEAMFWETEYEEIFQENREGLDCPAQIGFYYNEDEVNPEVYEMAKNSIIQYFKEGYSKEEIDHMLYNDCPIAEHRASFAAAFIDSFFGK